MSDHHHLQLIPKFLKNFFFYPLLVILLHTPEANSGLLWNYCPTEFNYTTKSTFQANLKLLLTSLSSGTVVTGYFNDTVGEEPPDKAYGLALCRGDVSSTVCQTCLDSATQDIVGRCPVGKESTIAYDECLLRYSNKSFFGTADTSYKYWAWNVNNVTDPQTFDVLLGNLMDSLTTEAVGNGWPKLFAAGMVNSTSFTKLYGLVQCTRDLSSNECYQCLQDKVGFIPNCCADKVGGKVYGQSCYLRFESYLFYNISAVDLSPPPPPSLASGRSSASSGGSKKVLVVVIAIVAPLVLLFVCFIYYLRRRKPVKIASNRGDDPELGSSESLLFDLCTIRSATNNFNDENKLGEGGFGPVYKGTLPNGDQVAVKRLSKSSGQGIAEMKNEVVLVSKLQHRNLVRLMGCCLEEDEKLLVYEYLPNTSLDKLLFDPIRTKELDWPTRHKIIEGIGRGLLYLHEDSRLRIIHRDLKASNILLDCDMNPKISDFGLAKIVGVDETQRNTSRIAGTYGYMAPEYAMHGIFSTKSDVFSFGILVLEIVTGQKNSDYQWSGNSEDLACHVWHHWSQGSAVKVIDQSLAGRFQVQEVLRCIHIALLCIQEDQAERPSMDTVILMLSSYSTSLPIPLPAFGVHGRTASESEIRWRDADPNSQSDEASKGSKRESQEVSNNYPSISDIDTKKQQD